jgi:DNA-directed RNA polymerase subunit F
MKVTSSKPVSLSEVKEIIEQRKEDGELGYEQAQALENVEHFAAFDMKKVQQLVKTLTENKKVSKETALKIIDICPDNPATLRAILVKDKVELSEEEIDGVLKELG